MNVMVNVNTVRLSNSETEYRIDKFDFIQNALLELEVRKAEPRTFPSLAVRKLCPVYP